MPKSSIGIRNLFRQNLSYVHGLIIPQGWGSRGAGGKIEAIRYAREHKIPYLGHCYGFQMAIVEAARSARAGRRRSGSTTPACGSSRLM